MSPRAAVAAIAITVVMALAPSSTGVCGQTIALGPDSGPTSSSSSADLTGPLAGVAELHSGTASPCSTASGSTDQLCSVLVSQQLTGMGREGPLKVGGTLDQTAHRLVVTPLQLLRDASSQWDA